MPVATYSSPQTATSDCARGHRPVYRVEIVGMIPPPYGGISVHCMRLRDHLAQRGISARVWDLEGFQSGDHQVERYDSGRLAEAVAAASEPVIVHWHKTPDRRALWRLRGGSAWGQRVFTVMTFHNERVERQFAAAVWWKRAILRRFFAHCDALVFANREAQRQGLAIGCPAGRVHVIPAFIPPVAEATERENLPQIVRDFLADHHPILAAGGWTIDFCNGVDLYGMDLLVETVGRLVADYPGIGLVYCLPHPSHPEYFTRLRERTKRLQVSEHILWVTEPITEAAALWKSADVFVRPTCTDGDALSLREALYFGVPAVASDAAERPPQTHLFANRDAEALTNVMRKVLSDRRRPDHAASAGGSIDYGDALIRLYDSLVGDGVCGSLGP